MTTTAPKPVLKLPEKLKDLDLKFAHAIRQGGLAKWPDGDEKFLPADQPHAIAAVLIQSPLHRRLVNARIAYLFRPEILKNGIDQGAVSSKASAKLTYLTDFDFLVEVSHKSWLVLTPEQRIAIIDHALCGCEVDSETGVFGTRLPDVEEYSEVVARWGAYTMPLRGFEIALERAQIDLFDGTALGLIEKVAPAIADATRRIVKDVAEREGRDKKPRGRRQVQDDAGTFELEDRDDSVIE